MNTKKATRETGKIMLINYCNTLLLLGFPGDTSGKESSCQCSRRKMQIGPLGQEGPLEEEMTPHSSILAWKIPWT